MNGINKINDQSYFEICNLSLSKKKSNAIVFSAKNVIEEIISFMISSSKYPSLRDDALNALQAVAMSSGSLAAIVQFIITLHDYPETNVHIHHKVGEMIETFKSYEKQQKELNKRKESSGI